MPAVLVIADDLTGANATGARFARTGLRVLSAIDDDPEAAGGYDVLVRNTASRHVAPAEAADRVAAVLDAAGDVPLVVKRTDTTLRGNVGAELAAALAHLRRRWLGARALVVPAFPEAGRVTVGGLQLVDGAPVARSAAGRDPLSPVRSSRVAEVVRSQVELDVREVPLDVVQADDERALLDALDADVDAVVVDAVDRRDLTTIAAAAARLDRERGVRWLSVDPGPFGPELARALEVADGTERASDPLLVVAGSPTATSREQLRALEQVHGARLLDVDVAALDVEGTVTRLVEEVRSAPPGGVVGLRTSAHADDVVALRGDAAAAVPRHLGAVVAAVLDEAPVGGVYATGGDVILGVVEALGSHGIAVDEEVLPLAVVGRLAGGPHDGLRIVSKGGLIGGSDAAVACVDGLRHRLAHRKE